MDITFHIPDRLWSLLAQQEEPVETLVLAAIARYLEEEKGENLLETETWQLCGKFEASEPTAREKEIERL